MCENQWNILREIDYPLQNFQTLLHHLYLIIIKKYYQKYQYTNELELKKMVIILKISYWNQL